MMLETAALLLLSNAVALTSECTDRAAVGSRSALSAADRQPVSGMPRSQQTDLL